jgi:hypothetical protein
VADQYDSPWKETIERHFADFLEFFFPAAHADIDWSKPVFFLDQELRAVVRDAELGSRFVDKLVQLTRRDGQPERVYVHLEVQGTEQAAFAERMFVYHYRLYDRYRQPIASLAVLADDRPQWRPETFGYEVFGCRLGLQYPVVKLLDWSGSEARLEDSDNPFALVTLAHLATRATRIDMDARYTVKVSLVRQLYKRGRHRQQVIDLVWMLDWMMSLPKALEAQWRHDVQILEEEINMPYISSFERAGIEKGLEKGLQQGLQQGQARLLTRQLDRRFGELPQWVKNKLDAASAEELETWADTILVAASLEEVFGMAGR